MDPNKYNRSIALHCPTCGGTDFSSSDESELVKCVNCNLELTKDDLIGRNQENIQAHTDELKSEVLDDVEKQLKKSLSDAFRGNKNIKIK
jgi:uncharacterized Zn finger protein (UPF0148 family)